MAAATKMTQAQIVAAMAETQGVSKKDAKSFIENLAALAVKQTKKTGEFTVPGIGKLVKSERKARWGRNPGDRRKDSDQGQEGRQVPCGESREGRDRSSEEVVPPRHLRTKPHSVARLSGVQRKISLPAAREARYLGRARDASITPTSGAALSFPPRPFSLPLSEKS